jgi:hypothetical protein
MRARANVRTATAENPSAVAGILEAHKQFVNTSGLGKVVAEGTQQERDRQALISSAIKDGWVYSDLSNQEQGLANYLAFQEETRRLETYQKQLTAARAEVGLDSDMLSLEEKRIGKQARDALGNMADLWRTNLTTQFNQLLQDVATGGNKEGAILQINQALSQVEFTAKQASMGQEDTYATSLIAPLKELGKQYIEHINGNISKTVLDNSVSNITARQKLIALGDPKISRLVAISSLFGNQPVSILHKVDEAAASFLGTNFDGGTASVFDPGAEGGMDLVTANIQTTFCTP